MKHELLVPVGNYASLIAAINNGADAVYLGGKRFGARAFANNFSDEELESVIKLCHLYEVKVYITVNTLIYEDEIKEALEYIRKIHKYGVDAVIMQDVGLINLVHQTFPNLEIHASTQMHNHSDQSLKFLGELGIKRVVFAREMPFEDINNLDTDLEKEVFIHGSLCISYSGQCLFSSIILNRSGNRGECAGMCRLPYELLENNKKIKTKGDYLLSPKDLYSFEDFKELLDSDIVSFKIEGRMKSPAYVAVVTRIYRKLIDQYENGEQLTVDHQDVCLLKAIFNRQYTKGFLFKDLDIMNPEAPNHMGIHLGTVIAVTNKKIKIKLDENLKQFEAIRFKNHDKGCVINFLYDQKDNLISEAKKGDVIYLDNFLHIKSLDEVLLTNPLMDIPKNIIKKIEVEISISAYVNQPLSLCVKDEENEIVITGDVVSQSINQPITKDRIITALSKCGNTPFSAINVKVNLDDNIFISIGSLNKLRREALNKLKELRENKKVQYQECKFNRSIIKMPEYGPVINVLVRTKEQVKACKDLGIMNVIVDDSSLMEPYFIYKIPRDKNVHDYSYENLLVTDYASLEKYPSQIADYHLNVYNHYTFDYLIPSCRSLMLSVELTMGQIEKLMSYYSENINAEVLIYGRIELMLLKHCLLKKIINQNKVCNVCQNGKRYSLKDRNNAVYPIINNLLTHGVTILNHEPRNWTKDIQKLLSLKINSFRVELYDESYDQTYHILKSIIAEISDKN